jgi:Sec-independent protein translocase protein TatA
MEDKFLFSVGGRSDFKVKLLKADSSRFLFGMKFEDEVVEGTVLDVKIVSSAVYSKNRAQLEKYRFSGKLPEYKPVENPDMEELMNSTHHIIKVAVTTSIGSSLISNPAAAWALLNTIQLLIFLPLNINEMTPNVRKFLKGFQGYNILPNFFEKIINSKASSEPYQEAKNFGLVTSMFLINAGKILTILIVALLLWPLAIVVSRSKAGNFSLKALKILGNFKYSFFLRFWIQGFLEILVFSLVQLRSVIFK